jgi:hypothetical protein
MAVMVRLTSLVLLIAAFSPACALCADQPATGPVNSPSYLDTFWYGGGDGLSKKKAVIVKSASAYSGIESEYAWIASRYPGAKRLSQALTASDGDGKRYDIITVRTSDGIKLVLWFDISAMYQMRSNTPLRGR